MKKTTIGAAIGMLVLGAAVVAMPAGKTEFDKHYKVKPGSKLATAGCALCHKTKSIFKEYNPYGAELKKLTSKAGDKKLTVAILKAVEKIPTKKGGPTYGKLILKGELPGGPAPK